MMKLLQELESELKRAAEDRREELMRIELALKELASGNGQERPLSAKAHGSIRQAVMAVMPGGVLELTEKSGLTKQQVQSAVNALKAKKLVSMKKASGKGRAFVYSVK